MTPVPTVGRTVHYTLTEADAEVINRRRSDASLNLRQIQEAKSGFVAHIGNSATEGQVCAAVIVRTWGETPESAVNLQVLLDGNDVYWAASRSVGDGSGHFAWPQRS